MQNYINNNTCARSLSLGGSLSLGFFATTTTPRAHSGRGGVGPILFGMHCSASCACVHFACPGGCIADLAGGKKTPIYAMAYINRVFNPTRPASSDLRQRRRRRRQLRTQVRDLVPWHNICPLFSLFVSRVMQRALMVMMMLELGAGGCSALRCATMFFFVTLKQR